MKGKIVIKVNPKGSLCKYSILYNDSWISIPDFVRLPEVRKKGIKPQALRNRLMRGGFETFEELFGIIVIKEKKEEDTESFYKEGVDPEIWEAMKNGTTHDFIKLFNIKKRGRCEN